MTTLQFLRLICLGCKTPLVLMGQAAKDEYEQKGEAYCATCKSYQRCQRGEDV